LFIISIHFKYINIEKERVFIDMIEKYTRTTSISNSRVAFAGILFAMPWLPYAKLGGATRNRFPPFFIPTTPVSHA
jgi:hypothetical protein